MVAYLSGGATILTAVIDRVSGAQVPIWTMILISLAIYGALIYGGTRTVDPVNRLLMVGLILAYGLLVIVGLPHVKATNLAHHSWSHVWMALPAMVTSFGFHNIVPTLRDYLHSNVKKLRLALAIGTAMPLLIYLLWQVIILGVLPLQGENGIEAALEQGLEATTALRATTGALVVTDVAQWFALFAIVTSFLGVALSFVDFLADGLKIPKNRTGLAGLCALALLPPVVLALTNPSIFLSALGFAGGICAVIVFGIFPPLMCFVARRRSHAKRMVPGGRFPLIACIAISVAIFVIEMVALVAP
jgi:tyrosine-specific transport protein